MRQGDTAMKATSMVTLFALLLCTAAGLAQSAAQQSFDALKGLTGEWRGKDTLGHQVEVTFRAISGGSAVLSEFMEPSQKEDMITMFHVDGDRLLLTHYCSAGNQPRMKGILSPDGKTITFDLGVTTFRRRSICRPDAGVPGLFGCGRANTDRSRR